MQRVGPRTHLQVGWSCLREYPLAEAIIQFTAALRVDRSLRHEGQVPSTVSCLFVILIAERMTETPAGDWETFGKANGNLLRGA